jgi:hypothetical protein
MLNQIKSNQIVMLKLMSAPVTVLAVSLPQIALHRYWTSAYRPWAYRAILGLGNSKRFTN